MRLEEAEVVLKRRCTKSCLLLRLVVKMERVLLLSVSQQLEEVREVIEGEREEKQQQIQQLLKVESRNIIGAL